MGLPPMNAAAKLQLRDDPVRLLGAPDVVASSFDVWRDVTAPTAWPAQEARYAGFGESIPLSC